MSYLRLKQMVYQKDHLMIKFDINNFGDPLHETILSPTIQDVLIQNVPHMIFFVINDIIGLDKKRQILSELKC